MKKLFLLYTSLALFASSLSGMGDSWLDSILRTLGGRPFDPSGFSFLEQRAPFNQSDTDLREGDEDCIEGDDSDSETEIAAHVQTLENYQQPQQQEVTIPIEPNTLVYQAIWQKLGRIWAILLALKREN